MIESLESLLVLPQLPPSLDLVQLSSQWDDNPEWRETRYALDARLFLSVLRGDAITIRRITYLDPPREADPHARRAHTAWIAGLVSDLYLLDMPRLGAQAGYRLRQLIRQPDPDMAAPLQDGWNSADDRKWAEDFDALWHVPRSIESNVLPTEVPYGPPADRDPRWYLWH